MKRSVIIAKCIGSIENSNKTLLTFDRPLNELCSEKFIYISVGTQLYFGTLLPNNIIEMSLNVPIEINKYYKISTYNAWFEELEWQISKQPSEKYKEETVLLWQELGSLENPPIEAIDLYINELNERT